MGRRIFLKACETNARSVAILITNNIKYKVSHYEGDAVGNMLLDIIISDVRIQLINIYGHNTDGCSFFNKIIDHEQDYIIWCGDFNIILNPDLDSHNYVNSR